MTPHFPEAADEAGPALRKTLRTDGWLAPMRSFGLVLMAGLSAAACSPTVGATFAGPPVPVVRTGYPPLPDGYCYLRDRYGNIAYETNNPAVGRCASGRRR